MVTNKIYGPTLSLKDVKKSNILIPPEELARKRRYGDLSANHVRTIANKLRDGKNIMEILKPLRLKATPQILAILSSDYNVKRFLEAEKGVRIAREKKKEIRIAREKKKEERSRLTDLSKPESSAVISPASTSPTNERKPIKLYVDSLGYFTRKTIDSFTPGSYYKIYDRYGDSSTAEYSGGDGSRLRFILTEAGNRLFDLYYHNRFLFEVYPSDKQASK
jgi:hypothetical protein